MSAPEPAPGHAGPEKAPEPGAFAEPWQAKAFALTVHLHDQGLFTWAEWADGLSQTVKTPGAAADGSDYYQHWLNALEALLARKGAARPADVTATAEAWQRAALATPHGQPVELPGMSRPSHVT